MILLDTCALISISNHNDSIKNLIEDLKIKKEVFAISAISLFEIYAGLSYTQEKLGEKIFKKQEDAFMKLINDFFIFEVSEDILKQAGIFKGKAMKKGIIFDNNNFIIGTTSILNGCNSLITQNISHFSFFNIQLINY